MNDTLVDTGRCISGDLHPHLGGVPEALDPQGESDVHLLRFETSGQDSVEIQRDLAARRGEVHGIAV